MKKPHVPGNIPKSLKMPKKSRENIITWIKPRYLRCTLYTLNSPVTINMHKRAACACCPKVVTECLLHGLNTGLVLFWTEADC